jgi:PPOX class probable F420-dependent enzyme
MSVKLSEAVRAFLSEPRMCVMATINADGTPQQTVMWYDLAEDGQTVILNTIRGLVKEKNLRRDGRMSVCIESGQQYVTLRGRATIVEDRSVQEREVNRMAIRYRGAAGQNHWDGIKDQDRLSIHMHIEGAQTRQID